MEKAHLFYHSSSPENDDQPKVISLETKDETAIWDNFIKGDDSALSYIYRSYANTLYNYGRQFAEGELVQDCIQDLFFDLIRTRKKLGQIVSVKAYLFSSLRRKIVRKIKKNVREVEENKLDNAAKFKILITSDGATPLDNFTLNKLELLKQACNSLPPKQRKAIMLYYYEKLSYKEIADIFEMGKVSSARILIYRALDTLKKKLGNVREDLLFLITCILSLHSL